MIDAKSIPKATAEAAAEAEDILKHRPSNTACLYIALLEMLADYMCEKGAEDRKRGKGPSSDAFFAGLAARIAPDTARCSIARLLQDAYNRGYCNEKEM